jgi:hypothetical protein
MGENEIAQQLGAGAKTEKTADNWFDNLDASTLSAHPRTHLTTKFTLIDQLLKGKCILI